MRDEGTAKCPQRRRSLNYILKVTKPGSKERTRIHSNRPIKGPFLHATHCISSLHIWSPNFTELSHFSLTGSISPMGAGIFPTSVSPVPGKQNGVNQSFPFHGRKVFIKMFKSINPIRLTVQCHIGNQRKG